MTGVIELDREHQQLAEELNHALIAQMARAGTLTTPAWQAAFEAVPRHLFVPRFRLPTNMGGHILDAGDPDQQEAWLRAVYHDEALLTEFDGDNIPTTSCSAPSVVAIMLEASQPADGQSTLEIGTGTGWTAGLLVHRLGEGAVTSIDINPACVAEARVRLDDLGLHPVLAVGDGYQGCEQGAPYDRIIATASLRQVPLAWLSQMRPGGSILTDLRGDFGGNLALVTVCDDQSANGRFLAASVNFMPLRSEQQPWVLDRSAAVVNASGERRMTSLDPMALRKRDFGLFAQLTMPGTRTQIIRVQGGPTYLCLVDPQSQAWARVELGDPAADVHPVTQGGDRRLWDELEVAHDLFRHLGQPPPESFVITITADGDQFVKHPDADRSWVLPL